MSSIGPEGVIPSLFREWKRFPGAHSKGGIALVQAIVEQWMNFIDESRLSLPVLSAYFVRGRL